MKKFRLLTALAAVLAILVLFSCSVQAKSKEYKSKASNSSRFSPPTADQLDSSTSDADSDLAPGADHHAHAILRGHGPPSGGARNGFPLPLQLPGVPGLGLLDKGAPDLQFGLALTIPFVSLATEKLLHTLGNGVGGPGLGGPLRSFRSWSDIASLLKLNVGGLVLAAVVGVAALFFLPSIFHGRGGILKGFGSNLLDNLVQGGVGGGLNKHFGYGQYEHAGGYGGSYDGFGGVGGGFNKYGYGRKGSRDLKEEINGTTNADGSSSSSVWNAITTTVQKNLPEISECSLYAMCVHGKNAAYADLDGAGQSSMSTSKAKEKAKEKLKFAGLGELNEYAGKLEEAFAVGRNSSADCATEFAGCARIPKLIDRVGRYIFGE